MKIILAMVIMATTIVTAAVPMAFADTVTGGAPGIPGAGGAAGHPGQAGPGGHPGTAHHGKPGTVNPGKSIW